MIQFQGKRALVRLAFTAYAGPSLKEAQAAAGPDVRVTIERAGKKTTRLTFTPRRPMAKDALARAVGAFLNEALSAECRARIMRRAAALTGPGRERATREVLGAEPDSFLETMEPKVKMDRAVEAQDLITRAHEMEGTG